MRGQFSHRRRLGKRTIAAVVGVLAVSPLAYIAGSLLTGNVHTVVADEVYRSAQPTPHMLERMKANEGIRSVINLRGENTGSPWYDAEVATARRLGLSHYDFRMSAKTALTEQQADALLDLMIAAPKPLLVHCQSGADRTGLASALYVAAVKKWGEDAAEMHLSLLYGHVAAPFGKGWAMTVTFETLEERLGFEES